MDHKYEEALERARKGMPIDEIFPELKESEDERIRKSIMSIINQYARMCEKEGDPCEASLIDDALAYLEKQKEQKPAKDTALQKAFISSKIDYTLEEKCDASDYAEAILPTSVTYGENEEEYKLHKIIEAAFIAGQKNEQQPVEWSEEDEKVFNGVIDTIKDAIAECDCDDVGTKARIIYEKELKWLETRLKSLRPQPHWKPSDEQMEWLESAVKLSTDKPHIHGIIISLYEQLKRL